jgi:hypothetical protein
MRARLAAYVATCALLVGCHGDTVQDFSGNDSSIDSVVSTDSATLDSTRDANDAGADASTDSTFDETSTDSSDSSVEGGTDTSPADVVVTDSGAVCGAHPGPVMVAVTLPDAGPTFCIDSTEVNAGQYAAFVGATLTFAPKCPTGHDYAPHTTSGIPPSDPVTNVLWCEAYDYCQWAGKRLCGNIYGGAVAFGSRFDLSRDQWYFACSNGKGTKYPYADTYQDATCAGGSAGSTIAVGSLSTCHGEAPPFDAIFDMSGNVAEWEDGCESDACPSRGGWIGSTMADLACDADNSQLTSEQNEFTGFRCCSK